MSNLTLPSISANSVSSDPRPTLVPGMATAGSGDVLSGIITGINSQNPADLCLNAANGMWIAGVAGEYAQKEKGEVSMTASDTAANIYKAVKEIKNLP